jgi:hypothetical protein
VDDKEEEEEEDELTLFLLAKSESNFWDSVGLLDICFYEYWCKYKEDLSFDEIYIEKGMYQKLMCLQNRYTKVYTILK